MPFEIVQNDLTNMQVDAIVNAANPRPVIGYGVDSGVHKKAGAQLLLARQKIGDLSYGDAAITPAYNLDAKYVIHAVSPIWQDGTNNESALLEKCYTQSLELALKYECESIAFPLLSAGNHGFPKQLSLQIAINVFSRFLLEHEMQIYLVVFSRSAVALSEKLFHSVKSYIDDTYVEKKSLEEYGFTDEDTMQDPERFRIREAMNRRRRAEMEYNSQILDADLISESTCSPELEASPASKLFPEPDAFSIFESVPEFKTAQAYPHKANAAPLAPAPSKTAPFAPAPYKSEPGRKLEDLMKEMDETFSESLIRLIDQKGLTDPYVYKKANIDRKLFSKIKNNKDYKPSKMTCVAFAIALELNLDETRDLIGKAGYALTHSSKFDIIIEFFILEQNYNTFEINEVLFAFDQPLIGA